MRTSSAPTWSSLSRAKLSQKDGHTLSLLLHSISDFERISDHAVNLLDSVKEMNEKKMSFSPAGGKRAARLFAWRCAISSNVHLTASFVMM